MRLSAVQSGTYPGADAVRHEHVDTTVRGSGLDEVADMRTPLSVLLEGEDDALAIAEQGYTDETLMLVERMQTLPLVQAAQLLQVEFDDQKRRVRLATFQAMLQYIWHKALNPWDAMKAVLAVTRRVRADLLQGISASEVGLLLQEKRATTSAREMRLVVELMERWGVKGVLGTGGAKSVSSRKTFAKKATGNGSRKTGETRKLAARLLGRRAVVVAVVEKKGRRGEGETRSHGAVGVSSDQEEDTRS